VNVRTGGLSEGFRRIGPITGIGRGKPDRVVDAQAERGSADALATLPAIDQKEFSGKG